MSTSKRSKILPTANEACGFYGTITNAETHDVEKAWKAASEGLAKALPNATPEDIRDLLDSRLGRCLADRVVDGEASRRRNTTALVEQILRDAAWNREAIRCLADRVVDGEASRRRNTTALVEKILSDAAWSREAILTINESRRNRSEIAGKYIEPIELPDRRSLELKKVAIEVLGLESLDEKGSDREDFRDLSVAAIRKALEAAYEAGKAAR